MLEALQSLKAQAQSYLRYKLDLLKLETAERTSRVLAALITATITAMILFLSVLFVSIALAIALAGWIGSFLYAFLIVAGLYLLVGIGIWIDQDRMIRLPIMNRLLSMLRDKENEDRQNSDAQAGGS